MNKIGIFYGSTGGSTMAIVEEIEFNLKNKDYQVINVKDGIKEISNFSNLILLTPTYGVGELQDDWNNQISELKKIDFTNKTIGIVGLGNQRAFGESFVSGMRILYDIIQEKGGNIVSPTSILGYSYQDTQAIENNKFIGLVLDETNQEDQTPERIQDWINDILKYFS